MFSFFILFFISSKTSIKFKYNVLLKLKKKKERKKKKEKRNKITLQMISLILKALLHSGNFYGYRLKKLTCYKLSKTILAFAEGCRHITHFFY